MPIGSKFRDRVLGVFIAAPTAVWRMSELEHKLTGVKKPVIQYWLKQLCKENEITKPRYGCYQRSAAPPDLEAIRQAALDAGKKRIVSTDRPWRPGEQVIQVEQHPTLPVRRRHFQSILERMKVNPSFSVFDAEFLLEEIDHLDIKAEVHA